MRDVELYRHLIGLAPPWTVSRVDLRLKEQEVEVWVEHPRKTTFPCPECGAHLSVYDHTEERVWRHLDSCQFKTLVRARIPRVECPEHGVGQARVPWAKPHSRFTLLFERLAIDVLKECDVLGATRILRISWDEAWAIMERAVGRGLAAKQAVVHTRLGVDEKSIAKGQKYFTLVCDLTQGTVEHIADGRTQESLDGFYRSQTAEQLAGLEGIAMDMWEPFFNSTLAHVPDAEAKIVFDRYHIACHAGQAVDLVRRQEHRALRAVGDDTLSGSKYLWLYREENVPEKHQERFDALKTANLKTARAWAIKESLQDLWSYRSRGWAERFWKRWYFWASHSRLDPVIKVARMVKTHLPNVLTYYTQRISNAMSEGLNSKIQTIKKTACGFRNKAHFKTAIYFHCGGLSLYPVHVPAG